MKTIQFVLAVCALVSTTCAVREYSRSTFRDLSNYMLLYPTKTAHLINSNIALEFQKTNRSKHNNELVLLKAISTPKVALAEEHDVCGNFHGISLNNGEKYFCNITTLGVEVETGNYKKLLSLQIVATFDFGKRTPLAELHVPIFKIPTSVQPEDKEKFEKWAHNERVGVSSPLDKQTLENIASNQPITLDFKWLNEVLQYGIRQSAFGKYKTSDQDEISPVLFTRPIVMLEDSIKEIYATLTV